MNKTSLAQQAKTTSVLPSTQSILQRQCACGTHTMGGGQCMDCAKRNSPLQRKLAIGASNDPLEQEADRVANQVLAAPAHSAMSGTPPRIQRFSGQLNGQMDAAPASVDQALASPGRPLEPGLRQDMEQRFGHDFSKVRVHSGGAAEQSAQEVNAHAYTVGHNIMFDEGQFTPGTHEGRRLIAHELTHVVQQGAAPRVACSISGRDLTVGKGSDAKSSITLAAPGIQRRNGGFRSPPRQTRGRVPSRGREGQREGQRLPRDTPARREAFARRERERIEAARKRFDELVARNQKWLENWAKEGSEPKTPAERAFRVLVKMLEAWDEVSSSWDKTHSALEATLRWRLDLGDAVRNGSTGLPSSIADFDRQLIAAWRELSHFDAEMLRRLTEWQERMDKWEEWRDRVYPTATNVINLSIDLAGLLLDAHMIASELRKQLSPLDRDIQGLLAELRIRYWLQTPGPRQTSMSEAD